MGFPKGPRAVPKRVGAVVTSAAEGNKSARFKLAGAAAIALVILLGLAFLYKITHKYVPPADYASGSPGPAVIVGWKSGQTADDVARTMKEKGVTESGNAFYDAAVQNSAMNSMQPGYFVIQSHIPAKEAVKQLVNPDNRVGHLVLSEGRLLLDNSDLDSKSVREGIFTKLAKASCYKLNGADHCLTHDDFKKAGSGDDLAALGVPDWLQKDVAKAPKKDRQLEGLIASGSWDFDPSETPVQIIHDLVSQSATLYEKAGIRDKGPQGFSPYQRLIMASLVERESHPKDFGKVARVIYNRLAKPMQLQFDSTVNYDLPETELATTDNDRARKTAWNTYAMDGLPATPIASPSVDAVKAVEGPDEGTWIYFVTVDNKGTTKFTDNYQEHLKNVEEAKNSGILDQGR